MHKDQPPGLFELARRSVKHVVVLGLVIGFFLSIVTHIVLLISRAEAGSNEAAVGAVENAMGDSNPLPAPSPAVDL